jgi:hypothetical protein
MLKSLLIILLSTLNILHLYPQKQENVSFTSDESLAFFKWDIERVDKGALMFLDIPYQRDSNDILEYLTLTLAISKTKSRPDFISIIVPSDIQKNNGIFLRFSKRNNSDIEAGANDALRLPLDTCYTKNKTCVARLWDGYANNQTTKIKEDVFIEFLKMDLMYVLLTYPDGGHKTIMIPLASFKNQFKTL